MTSQAYGFPEFVYTLFVFVKLFVNIDQDHIVVTKSFFHPHFKNISSRFLTMGGYSDVLKCMDDMGTPILCLFKSSLFVLFCRDEMY